MFRLNERGSALIQATIAIALFGGISLMTMRVSEQQAKTQKRMRASAELENAVSIVTQTLTKSSTCGDMLASMGSTVQTVPSAAADENALASRTLVPPGTGIITTGGATIYGNGITTEYNNIIVDEIYIGPAVNNAGQSIQLLDIWVAYTKTGIGNVNFNAPGVAPRQDWVKLENVLTAELNGGGAITKCYTNADSINSGARLACESLGGSYDVNLVECALGDADPKNAVSLENLDDQIGTFLTGPDNAIGPSPANLSEWSEREFINQDGDTLIQGELDVDKLEILSANANDPKSGLNFETAKEIMNNPDDYGLILCDEKKNGKSRKPDKLGFIQNKKLRCVSVTSLTCGNNERMVGFKNNSIQCINLIGGDTGCTEGQLGTLTTDSNGAVIFQCVDANTEYLCTVSGWSGGDSCAATDANCNSGTSTIGDEMCCAARPESICSSGNTGYICKMSGGGWTPGTFCGAQSGLCYSGTPADKDPACCPSAPTTDCGGGKEYDCDLAGGTGWSVAGDSCGPLSLDCSDTNAVVDDYKACCLSAPDPMKCPASSNKEFICDFASDWKPTGVDCGAVSGKCSSGTPSDNEKACCASSPTSTCTTPITTKLFTCNTASGTWGGGSASCSAPSPNAGFCTSGNAPSNGQACCDGSPSASTCQKASTTTLYTCNTASGTWGGGSASCSAPSPDAGYCTSGNAPSNGQACCTGSPSASTCKKAITTNLFTCNTSTGIWGGGSASCSSPSPDAGYCTSGNAPSNGQACCTGSPSASTCKKAITTNLFTCNTSTGIWGGGSASCSSPSPDAGYCTSGNAPSNGQACCTGSPSASTCKKAITTKLFTCNTASGTWGGGSASCSSPSPDAGYCTSGNAPSNGQACCTGSPSASTCKKAITTKLFTCNTSTGTWGGGSASCSSPSPDSGYCSGGNAPNNGQACCTGSPSSSTCKKAITTRLYSCNTSTGNWGGGSSTCSSPSPNGGYCTSGNAPNNGQACCDNSPSSSTCKKAITTRLYSCNTSTGNWGGGSSTCSSPSPNGGYCTSGNAPNNGQACCDNSPSSSTCKKAITTRLYSCNTSTGNWGGGSSTCTSPSPNGGYCNSGNAPNNGQACCDNSPSSSTCKKACTPDPNICSGWTYCRVGSCPAGCGEVSTVNNCGESVKRCRACSGVDCFIKKTLITMADGSLKRIENIKKGDQVLGSNGTINTVKRSYSKNHYGNLYSLNGGKFFVTGGHPFKSKEGWKSLESDIGKRIHPNLGITQLKVGDILETENGDIVIDSIESRFADQTIYNFDLDGNEEYYADGYLVHNK